MGVKETWLGRHYYAYDCQCCGVALRSPFDETGTEQVCPKCGVVHVVPGKWECVAYLDWKRRRKEIKAAARKR